MPDNAKHTVSREDLMSLALEKERYVKLAQIYVRDQSDAEDIFHDCLLYIYDRMDRLMVSDLKSYFSITVKNRCLRHLKEKSRKAPVDNTELGGYLVSRLEENNEGRLACGADFPALFRHCAKRLPQLTMDVFEAKRLEHLSYKEISKIFGITENRINFEIKRALKVFREEFREYGLDF